ncbi:ORF6C domain-containing protein [Listeria valentina]|uniref:ORF6C domain-containing protein n=1 Tax=Listeria valentina TaxID=2705293 RepID=UPI00142F5199|nr:ORF6C domain-containing protein [Listeria valentina]
MNQLRIMEFENTRVLTSQQIAEAYEVDLQKIQQNFNYNRQRYEEGKHYYLLEGEELRAFKRKIENFEVAKNLNKLYLWTEKGALLHAKSLNTNKAWDVYDKLVDHYYKTNNQPMSIEQMMIRQLQEMQTVKTDVAMLKDTMRIDGNQQYTLKEIGKKRALSVLGGYQSKAYEAISKKVFSQMWRDFKKQFLIPRYGDLSKKDFEAGMDFLNMWLPETSVRLEIKNLNQQENLFND